MPFCIDRHAKVHVNLGWYNGMSSKFLAVKGGRLIILAGNHPSMSLCGSYPTSSYKLIGTDRLDKTLIIGQMQGWLECFAAHTAEHQPEASKNR